MSNDAPLDAEQHPEPPHGESPPEEKTDLTLPADSEEERIENENLGGA